MAALLPVEITVTHLSVCGGGPKGRAGRVRKISPPTGIRSPDHPARSESLYRLSYRGPYLSDRFTSLISIFF